MADSPISPHLATPAELKRRLEVERTGQPFVVYRDNDGGQRLVVLPDEGDASIGRDAENMVPIPWDPQVSALHAELRRAGSRWLVVDDGLSRNGTFVNEERVTGRRRLRDGDQLRVGGTVLAFRQPAADRRQSTMVAAARPLSLELSPAQRRVLVALCRPYAHGEEFARPATNQEIAEELTLSVAAVKTHLRTLFVRFQLDGLAQNEKRARLAQDALRAGIVSPSELRR
jgi:pSer/pThr/pTyr-binding forkhead associated (FHA) protein